MNLTPIHAIANSVWLIEKDSTEFIDLLNIISRNTNRLKKLADDLLDTARIESNNLISDKEKTDIKEAISTIIKDVKIDLDVKLNKEKEIFGENNNDILFKKHKDIINIFLFSNEEHDNIYHPLYIMVDRKRIIQAISNLINNSIKSIDNNDGSITITISRRDREKNNFSKKKR